MRKLAAFISFIIICGNVSVFAAQKLYPILEDQKIGFINDNGQIVVYPIYETDLDQRSDSRNNIPTMSILDHIRQNDKMISMPAVEIYSLFGLIDIITDKYNLILDENGEIARNTGEAKIGQFSSGLAPVRFPHQDVTNTSGGEWGYVNKDFEEVITAAFSFAGAFSDGLGLVLKDDYYGYIDSKGEIKIDFNYIDASDFSEGLAAVSEDGSYGYINTKGEQVIPAKFNAAGQFSDGVAMVREYDRYRYIDKNGKYINDSEYETACAFRDGLGLVKVNGKYGYINNKGETVISAQYDEARGFACGLAAVKQDGKWGFIDKSGKLVIKPKYDRCRDFDCKMAVVWDNGAIKYINRAGKDVYNICEYDPDNEMI